MSRARREFPGATPYRDRHGARRWRYRKGAFSAELGRDYGSPDFVRRYEAALRGARIGADRLKPGSMAALVASYYDSAGFRSLGASTRATYRNVLERFRERYGEKSAANLERRHVIALVGEKADTPAAANLFLRLLGLLMQHAIDIGLRDDDPTRDVRRFRMANKGAKTWSEDDIARFLEVHQPGTTAYLALMLMLHTGAARVDAVALGWRNIEGGRLRYRRRKMEGRTDRVVDIPVHPDLAAALADLPRERFTFLETRLGSARSPKALGVTMRAWCDAADLPECSSHGLRKACARRLAEAGATAHEIAAVTGHATISEVQRYTAAADRASLADSAFEKMAARPKRERNVVNHPARFAKPGGK
jgi:integrase